MRVESCGWDGGRGGPEQQAFDGAAGRARGVEAGGDDGGVVAEKRVARAQVGGQVAEMPVFQPARLPVHDQQARRIAPLRRLLGDEPLRQRVVEKIGG